MDNISCRNCTFGGKFCSSAGIITKDPAITALQDLLLHGLMGLAIFAHRARRSGYKDREIDEQIPKYLHFTSKSTNFSIETLKNSIYEIAVFKNRAERLYKHSCRSTNVSFEELPIAAEWQPAEKLPELISQGHKVCVIKSIDFHDTDIIGLREIVKLSLMGISDYIEQITRFESVNDDIYENLYHILDFMAEKNKTVDEYIELALECGELNFKVMEKLHNLHIKNYGRPEPTEVKVTPAQGKSILVSGNDYKILEKLLEQTQDKKINIYTHGEMVSAHAFPELRKYKHLIGYYGGRSKDIKKVFESFPGSILIASNNAHGHGEFFRGRIYSIDDVSWPGIFSIDENDLRALINAAYDSYGFMEELEEEYISLSFGEKSLNIYSKRIIEYIQEKKLEHFIFLQGCCDADGENEYFDEITRLMPENSIILSLACDKYRFSKEDFGYIKDLPKFIDLGNYNDAYPAIKMLLSISEKSGININELPVSIIVSWNEQKAIATLMTLLYLGVRNIKLGPIIPVYISQKLLDLLQDRFNIEKMTYPEKDIEKMFKKSA